MFATCRVFTETDVDGAAGTVWTDYVLMWPEALGAYKSDRAVADVWGKIREVYTPATKVVGVLVWDWHGGGALDAAASAELTLPVDVSPVGNRDAGLLLPASVGLLVGGDVVAGYGTRWYYSGACLASDVRRSADGAWITVGWERLDRYVTQDGGQWFPNSVGILYKARPGVGTTGGTPGLPVVRTVQVCATRMHAAYKRRVKALLPPWQAWHQVFESLAAVWPAVAPWREHLLLPNDFQDTGVKTATSSLVAATEEISGKLLSLVGQGGGSQTPPGAPYSWEGYPQPSDILQLANDIKAAVEQDRGTLDRLQPYQFVDGVLYFRYADAVTMAGIARRHLGFMAQAVRWNWSRAVPATGDATGVPLAFPDVWLADRQNLVTNGLIDAPS